MCGRRIVVVAISLMALPGVTLAQGRAETCAALAKQPLFETRSVQANEIDLEQYRSWYCDDTTQKNSTSDDTNASLKVLYQSVSGDLGWSQNKGSLSDFSKKVCQDTSYFRDHNRVVSTKTIEASKPILDVLRECVKTVRGLNLWTERYADGIHFDLVGEYNRVASDTDAHWTFKAANVSPAVGSEIVTKGGGSDIRIRFTKQNNLPATVTVNSNVPTPEGSKFDVPGLPSLSCQRVADGTGIQIAGKGYDGVRGNPGFVLTCKSFRSGALVQASFEGPLAGQFGNTNLVISLCLKNQGPNEKMSDASCGAPFYTYYLQGNQPLQLTLDATLTSDGQPIVGYLLVWESEQRDAPKMTPSAITFSAGSRLKMTAIPSARKPQVKKQ